MNRKRIAIPIVVLVLVIAAVVFWRSRAAEDPSGLTASGTVEATEARLGFETGGRIVEIAVEEGDRVSAGQPLARVDAGELDARRAQAEARVAAASAQLSELERGARPEEIGEAEAVVEAARERAGDAASDLDRSRRLEAGGAISPEALQHAETTAGVARAQLDQARDQLNLVRRGPRAERIAGARAQVEEARAAVRSVEASLVDAAIVAPHAGLVTVRHRQPNEIVAPGQPVLTIMNPADRWVRIFVPENRIGGVHVGDAASIRSDTFPEKRYTGRVVHISPEAEFTPKSVQTAEERVRLVYGVKVQIDGDPEMELKPGMPADVELHGAAAPSPRG